MGGGEREECTVAECGLVIMAHIIPGNFEQMSLSKHRNITLSTAGLHCLPTEHRGSVSLYAEQGYSVHRTGTHTLCILPLYTKEQGSGKLQLCAQIELPSFYVHYALNGIMLDGATEIKRTGL